MSQTYPLTLGGRRWELAELPFGIIRKLQPRLFRLAAPFVGAAAAQAPLLSESVIEEMLDIVVDAIKTVDPTITRDALDALHFGVADLQAAQTAIMLACGLELRARGEPAGPKA